MRLHQSRSIVPKTAISVVPHLFCCPSCVSSVAVSIFSNICCRCPYCSVVIHFNLKILKSTGIVPTLAMYIQGQRVATKIEQMFFSEFLQEINLCMHGRGGKPPKATRETSKQGRSRIIFVLVSSEVFHCAKAQHVDSDLTHPPTPVNAIGSYRFQSPRTHKDLKGFKRSFW